MRNLGRYRKFVVALLSAAAVIAAELPPDAPGWLTGTFAVLGAFGVLYVRNDQPPRHGPAMTRIAEPDERPRRP
jgi:hypothetical protein